MPTFSLPIRFHWSGNGDDEIYLTGSWNNWQELHPMHYGQIEIELPFGYHEYKFIVNGKWLYDQNKPMIENDEDTCNNFIDKEEMVERYLTSLDDYNLECVKYFAEQVLHLT